MKQVLFVLQEGRVGYWKLQRGQLSQASLKGDPWIDFAPSYWDEWKTANQVSEDIDALLLSDCPNGFGELPDWLRPTAGSEAAWSFDDLKMLGDDSAFSAKGLVVVQGGIERELSAGENPLKFHLTSSFAFVLPKEKKPEPPPVIKPSVMTDCVADDKSKLIKKGDVIGGKVKAFSKFRGSYIESPAASDLFCIRPEEIEKAPEFAEALKTVGGEVSMTIVDDPVLGNLDSKIKLKVSISK